MNEEVLNLVLKYPQLLDNFSQKYRRELFVLYYKRNPLEGVPGYVRVADAYNKAKTFKVSSVSLAIQEIFGLKRDNANMQINYAKNKGLIEKKVKTTHSRGYRQKNYVPKSQGYQTKPS